ncbi:MAG TPA: hypothetical protein VJ863_06180 [Sphaerochaeta sp.]|nr:hypothetical protein [Sphaerochaeta sp.]
MIRVQSYAPEGFIALDNSALIYPPTEARYNANTYRLSMDLQQEIIPQILELALHNTLDRCSYAKVSLHKGFFWYYLSPNHKSPVLYEEGSYPSARISLKDNNGYLFKVLYSKHRIALECFHALTDGSGALVYLKMIVSEYCRIADIADAPFEGSLDFAAKPTEQEFSDPFQHFYDKDIPGSPSTGRAYHRKGTGSYDDRVKVISAMVDANVLRSRCKDRGYTITVYLASILVMAFQEFQKHEVPKQKKRKPIKLSVPMNLRNIFHFDTMRNFTLFAVPGIEPALGEYTFEDILKKIHLDMALSQDSKKIRSQIKRNVGGERHILMRFAPTAIKNPLFKLLSDSLGDDLYSAVISNLGYVKVPQELESSISRMDFYLCPGKMNKVSLAVIGFKDKVVINFSSFFNNDTALERLFCRFLVEDGIPVEVSTNRTSENKE